MEEFDNLFKMRKSLDKFEQEMGINEFSNLEKSVLEFIASANNATITSITKTDYFRKYSLSSIKRAVNALIDYKFIKQVVSSSDKRSKFLVYIR
jgi:DNA-binding MarR family transcriptional regulator